MISITIACPIDIVPIVRNLDDTVKRYRYEGEGKDGDYKKRNISQNNP